MYIYVQNLPPVYPAHTLADYLRVLFGAYGVVSDVEVKMEKLWHSPSTPYAFIQMPETRAAEAAIEALHASDFGGRPIIVTAALPEDDLRVDPRWTPVACL